MPGKVAHQPLLAPGRHVMTMDDLERLAVRPFPASSRRPILFRELKRLHDDLNGAGVICELWVDGSFLTEKPEPDDIDLCFAAFDSDFRKLDKPIRDAISENLDGGKQYSPLLDTYICLRFMREDPRFAADTSDYWSGLWGVGHDDALKGFVVIKLGESNVRLNLLA